MNFSKLLCVVAVLCALFAVVAASESMKIDKCKACKTGCIFLKKDSDQAKCNAICDLTVCSGSQSDSDLKLGRIVRKVGRVAKKGAQLYGKYQKYKKFIPVADEELSEKINKCQLCKTGCLFAKKNADKCNAICDLTVCANSHSDSDLKLGRIVRKVGRVAKKGAQLYGKYQKYRKFIPVADSDLKLGRIVRKVGRVAKKGAQLYGKYQKYRKFIPVSDEELSEKINKCQLCKTGCMFAKKNADKCNAVCDLTVCSGSQSDSDLKLGRIVRKVGRVAKKGAQLYGKYQKYRKFIPVSDEEVVAKKGKKTGKKIGRFFRKNKCKICKAGCQFAKNSEKCTQVCELTVCSKVQADADLKPKAPKKTGKKFGSFVRKNRCKFCQKGCSLVKDEAKKAKCEKFCARACEKKSDKKALPAPKTEKKKSDKKRSDKKRSGKKTGKKFGRFFRKHKCQLCKVGCQFAKKNKDTCVSLCEKVCAKKQKKTEEPAVKPSN